jgi:F-type H+-transporting ATPase subunit delta
MPAATVAGVYAQALLQLAEERGKRTAVVESCREAADGLGIASISQLDDPRLGKAKAKAALKAAFAGKLEAEVVDLLLLLIDRNRLADAPAILREAVRLAEIDVGLLHVYAATAHPITADGLQSLSQRLRKTIGAGVVVHPSTDPQLIAGMTLRFGDTMIDASVRRQLGEMKQAILNAPLSPALWTE